MDTQTAELLARADRLTPEIQRMLWRAGPTSVRRTLAGRADLIDELSALAVTDDDLIARWASVNRSDRALLAAAVHTTTSDHSAMVLLSRQILDPAMCAVLAAKCSPIVGWELVAQQRPDNDLAVQLVTAYVASMPAMQDGTGRIFDEHLHDDPVLWAAAAEASRWETLPVLRAAASRTSAHPEIASSIITTLERFEDRRVGPLGERDRRSIDAVVTDVLRCPTLPADWVDRLAAIAMLEHRRSELVQRRDADVAGLLAVLPNDSSLPRGARCRESSHVPALKALAVVQGQVALPGLLVAGEALHHRHDIGEAATSQLVSATRGGAARELAAVLDHEGRLEDLAHLAETLGALVLSDLADPSPILELLASRGSLQISDQNVPDSCRPAVVRAYRPLRNLMSHPGLLTVALDAIESLDDLSGDTALHLIGEWDEDLPSLLQASLRLIDF